MKKNEISIMQICFKKEDRQNDFETFLIEQNINFFSYPLPLSYQLYRRPGTILTYFIHVKEGLIVCYPHSSEGYSFNWLHDKKEILPLLKKTIQNTTDSFVKENISYILHICRLQLLFM